MKIHPETDSQANEITQKLVARYSGELRDHAFDREVTFVLSTIDPRQRCSAIAEMIASRVAWKRANQECPPADGDSAVKRAYARQYNFVWDEIYRIAMSV